MKRIPQIEIEWPDPTETELQTADQVKQAWLNGSDQLPLPEISDLLPNSKRNRD